MTVAGTVAPSDATVDVGGSPATVSSDGRFAASASVESGTTTIEVIARAPERSPAAAAVFITGAGGSDGSSGGSSGSGGSAGGIPTDTTSCGGGLAVGPSTSCAFARNVHAEYMGKGAGTYMIFSPVMKRKYTMTCTATTVVVTCQAATGAYVYFVR